jgi:hypothetical protein
VLLLLANAGKAQWILHRIWDLWQIETALKHGIDVIIKYAGIVTLC